MQRHNSINDEEIFGWLDEPSERLFYTIGSRLREASGALAFSGDLSDLSSSNDKITEEGKDWYQANREEIFSVIGNVNEEDKYDLAIIIANLVLNKYPFVIIGPLCAVCTLDILNELGPISEIPAQGDISGTVIELGKGNLRTIFEGAITREGLAQAISEVLDDRELSLREAAAFLRKSKGTVQSARNGTATIDVQIEILNKLGCTVNGCILYPERK